MGHGAFARPLPTATQSGAHASPPRFVRTSTATPLPAKAKPASTVNIRRARATAARAAREPARRAGVPEAPSAPIQAVTGPGAGQSGYVHYFLIKGPDGILESHVGIELPDQRIAWSFPELGVSVSPFIDSGTVPVPGGVYEVQHLFGIRPFADDGAMRRVRDKLPERVSPWIDHGVQYCEGGRTQGELCVSCLGFALRILFPGPFPALPELPAEFAAIGSGEHYTTEDLLVYLAGLHRQATEQARLQRIDENPLPQPLREELYRLASAMNDSATAKVSPADPPSATKIRSGPRSAQRLLQRKRL